MKPPRRQVWPVCVLGSRRGWSCVLPAPTPKGELAAPGEYPGMGPQGPGASPPQGRDPAASVAIVRRQGAFLVVELALQDAQAGVGQVAGVPPAEQFLALRVDDRPPGLQRRLVLGRGPGC